MRRVGVLVTVIMGLLMIFAAVSAQAGSYPLALIENTKDPYQVHLRKGAGTSTDSLGLYYSGTQVVVNNSTGDWWQVEIGGRQGYIQAKFLVSNGDQGMPGNAQVYDARPSGFVSNPNPADRLHLRAQPSETATSYGKHYNGTQVQILGVVGDWYHVSVEGSTGFMMSKFIQKGGSTAGSIGIAMDIATPNNPNPADRLHLRKEAKDGAVSLGKYYNGVMLEVLRYESDTWALVRIGDIVGFMQKKYLAFGANVSNVASAIPTMTVYGATAKEPGIREVTNEKATPVCFLSNETPVQIWGILDDGWYHVYTDVGGFNGYMQGKYLK